MNLAILLIALVIAAALAFRAKKTPRRADDAAKRRVPLTNREQAMYHRLRSSLPEHIILAQVSLGALLTARSHAARNRFNQKIADFVVCTPAFDVIAVIELDDNSHKTRRDRDAARDAMLARAGIRTIRYAHTPDPTPSDATSLHRRLNWRLRDNRSECRKNVPERRERRRPKPGAALINGKPRVAALLRVAAAPRPGCCAARNRRYRHDLTNLIVNRRRLRPTAQARLKRFQRRRHATTA